MNVDKRIARLIEQRGALTALVTGACSGMGRIYAFRLAQAGCNLLLVSNRQTELEQTANEIASRYGVGATAHCMDLAQPDSAKLLFGFCQEQGFNIDILVNNVGMFFFHELTPEYHGKAETMLQLHIMTTTRLCLLFGEEMKKRQFGYILNVSSMAARTPMPGITIYSATKAYLRNFGKSLYHEMRCHNVSVSTICPGAVATPLYKINPKTMRLGVKLGLIATPEWVVDKALKGMLKRKKIIAPGFMNIYLPPLVNILSNRQVNRIWRRIK